MKAIQTRYKGYRFRSRLEARYAVLFDALGIRWDYEPEGFELPGGLRYLPDFWLHIPGKPGWGYWIEVKALSPTPNEVRRLEILSKHTRHHGWFFIGTPGNGLTHGVSPNGKHWPLFDSAPIGMCAPKASPEDVDRAINAARSARFEFGESGARA